jgi:hypothetical protein
MDYLTRLYKDTVFSQADSKAVVARGCNGCGIYGMSVADHSYVFKDFQNKYCDFLRAFCCL